VGENTTTQTELVGDATRGSGQFESSVSSFRRTTTAISNPISLETASKVSNLENGVRGILWLVLARGRKRMQAERAARVVADHRPDHRNVP
jgi:hypothetical protein